MEEFVQSLFVPLVPYTDREENLLQEHLRRLAVWCQKAGIESRWPLTDVGFLGKVDKEEEQRGFAELNDILEGKSVNPFQKLSVRNLICWKAMEDRPFPKLSDPFAPLVELYQSGGNSVEVEEGHLSWLGGEGISVHTNSIERYLDCEPFV